MTRYNLVFMCGEMYDKHVGPTHRTGEDACSWVKSIASIRMDPIILKYLLPSSVIVARSGDNNIVFSFGFIILPRLKSF